MRFNEKQCRYTSLLVTLCIILSCLVSYTSTISTPFIDQAASVHSEEAIYNLSITSSGEDICTPEMLGRQELISRPEISHKIRTFSNTYKSLLYLANISDTIHIRFHNLSPFQGHLLYHQKPQPVIYHIRIFHNNI